VWKILRKMPIILPESEEISSKLFFRPILYVILLLLY